MTGRLDRVDLPSDLLLVALYRRESVPDLSRLYSTVLNIDTDSFVFDPPYGKSEDYLDDIRMFEHLGFLELDGSLAALTDVELTDRGETMAELLDEVLTEDQQASFAEVFLA